MFKKNADGDLIGYHIEGGETLDVSAYLPISIDNLIDNKPLFLGYESVSWYPFHLDKEDYKILEITFSEPKTMEFSNKEDYDALLEWNEFYSATHMKDIVVTKLSLSGENLVTMGYNLFCLTKSLTTSGDDELLESFLINSSKFVKQIREISRY